MRLTTRVFLQIFISVLTVVLPAVGIQVYERYQSLRENFLKENVKILESIRLPVAEALWNFDVMFAKQMAISVVITNHVQNVVIYDESMSPVVGFEKSPDNSTFHEALLPAPKSLKSIAEKARLLNSHQYVTLENFNSKSNHLVLALPILLLDSEEQSRLKSRFALNRLHGIMVVTYNTETIEKEFRSSLIQSIASVVLVVLSLIFFIYLSFRKSVILPIRRIAQFVENVHHRRDEKLNLTDFDTHDFKRFSQTLNEMIDSLNARDQLIINQQKQMLNASKMSTLGEVSSGIAHEINNPLSIIMGYTYVLKDKILKNKISTEEIVSQLSKILDMTEQISKIIKGMNSFSRNSSHDPMVSFPLRHLIDTVVEFSAQRFKKSQIELFVSSAPDIYLKGRESQLVQVLLNLLNNSHDAVSKKGPDQAWVRLEFDISSGLKIFVTDSGLGISPNLAERIMEPFFTTKEVGQGVGLGLSIARNIIHEHGGDLSLNAECKNTQFIISFPEQVLTQIPDLSSSPS